MPPTPAVGFRIHRQGRMSVVEGNYNEDASLRANQKSSNYGAWSTLFITANRNPSSSHQPSRRSSLQRTKGLREVCNCSENCIMPGVSRSRSMDFCEPRLIACMTARVKYLQVRLLAATARNGPLTDDPSSIFRKNVIFLGTVFVGAFTFEM